MSSSNPPDLVMVGHGSRDPGAGVVLRALRDAVERQLHAEGSAARVVLAWIELDAPLVADVVRPTEDPAAAAVIVPLLLSRGTHVGRDLPSGAREPLGPDTMLTQMLLDRIAQAGIRPGRSLVLAATGSADPAGIADVQTQARMLQTAWGSPVRAGFVTAQPSIPQAAAMLRAAGGTAPAIVSYFLAPGRLPDSAGADSAHLGDHPALVSLVIRRYRGAAPDGARSSVR